MDDCIEEFDDVEEIEIEKIDVIGEVNEVIVKRFIVYLNW